MALNNALSESDFYDSSDSEAGNILDYSDFDTDV